MLAVLLIAVQAGWSSGNPATTAMNGGVEKPYLPQFAFTAMLWAVVYAIARWKKRNPETWLAWTFIFGWIPPIVLLFKKRRVGGAEDAVGR